MTSASSSRARRVVQYAIPARYGDTGPTIATFNRRDSRARARSATRSARRLGHDRRSVAENLGHSLHHLGRVVAHADHRVGAHLLRVPEHHLEGLAAGLFAKFGEQDRKSTRLNSSHSQISYAVF